MSHGDTGRRDEDARTASPIVSRRRVLQGTLGAVMAVPLARVAAAQDSGTPVVPLGPAVAVFPSPGCRAASPGTEISFRGAPIDELGEIEVTGSKSGAHPGVWLPHSDGEGASFLPDALFEPGETVTVRTGLDVLRGDNGAFEFTVATPLALEATPRENDPAKPNEIWSFRSRPDLAPTRVAVRTLEDGTASGYLFLDPKRGRGQNGPLIMDDQGQPVWWRPTEPEYQETGDFRVQTYQGRPVLTWWQGIATGEHSWGHWVICDETYQEVASVQIGNGYAGADIHEFVITPRGTALVNVYNSIRWDTTAAGGAAKGGLVDGIVQEIDIATGRVVFEWHSVDHIDLEESYIKPSAERPTATFDYFHINSVNEDDDGNLIVSARHTWAAYKIDRQSGEVIWRLGGKRSDFEMGEGAAPAYQHDAHLQSNGELTFFDNIDYEVEGAQSRGLVLTLDQEAMTATLAREYLHPKPLVARSQGNMQILPNGNVLIGWGSEGWLSEYSADGTLLFDAQILSAKHSYRSYRFPWIGRPAEPPAVAVERESGGRVTVYASWNGATEVASWRVLAGASAGELEPVGEPAPRAGFETEIAVETDADVFAVEALDADGEVLGRSDAVEA